MTDTVAPEAASPGRRFVEPAIALAIFVVALGWIRSSLHLTLELRDEGYLLYNISRVASGEIPHRDFIEAYGPGVYALTAPVYHLSGERVMAVRELLAVLRAVAVTLAYLLARFLVPRSFALLGAAFALGLWGWSIWNLNTPYAALLTVPICLVAALLLMAGQRSGRKSAYWLAGVVCGVAVLFKWTLAAVTAYGLVLAVIGHAMLGSRTREGRGPWREILLVVWLLAGGLIVLPFIGMLRWTDYWLHLAPIHALMVVIGVAFHRSGNGRVALARAWPLVVRISVGFMIAPALTLALYAWWDSFDSLLYGTVMRPLAVKDYYLGIEMPSLGFAAAFGMTGLGVAAALLGLGGRVRASSWVLGGALLSATVVWQGVPSGEEPLTVLTGLLMLLPALTAYATIGLIAASLFRTSDHARPGPSLPDGLVCAVFFQMMMTFQIYPRAGYNATLMLGTLGPLVAYLAMRAHRLALSPEGARRPTGWRVGVAFGLVAVWPAIFVARQVAHVLSARSAAGLQQTEFHAPQLAGIHPPPEDLERFALDDFDAVTVALRGALPADAPLVVLQNESMLYVATGREPVFKDQLMLFFLAGWGLLPEHDPDLPAPGELIRILASEPDAIVVTRLNNAAVDGFDESFPELARHIRSHYRPVASIGDYRILRRRGASR